jgi:hypothetical protein
MLTDDGFVYFCRLCGDYKPETEFYKSKDTHFGVSYKCKIHFKKTKQEDDDSMSYLKLQTITDSDFEQTQQLLENLGYKFGRDQEPVWRQFERRHNLNKKNK